MALVRNIKGQISLPLSSVQVFQASCPKVKSDLSISLNDALIAELKKKDNEAISFYEDAIQHCPAHRRQYGESSFGYPKQVPPKLMPTMKALGVTPTVYLLHSLAHIEINAVEIAWDTIIRFSHRRLPSEFYCDFLSIAADEARHFNMLCDRLKLHNSYYGAIPGHDNLWSTADKTSEDVLARVAAIQLVQEPRALDSAERLVNKFEAYNDKESAKLMRLICEEEIRHVQIGMNWFTSICLEHNLEPKKQFRDIVKKYVGIIPPPFNVDARKSAGMEGDWYLPVSLKSSNLE